MKSRLLSILSFLFLGVINLYAQDDCEKCLGKIEWKSERILIQDEIDKTGPFNSIVKLGVKKWYNGGYYGSASFLDDNTIITAQHNVIRKSHITRISYTLNGQLIQLRKKDCEIYYYKKKLFYKTDVAIIKITNPDKIYPVKTKFEIEPNILEKAESEIHLTGFPCDYSGKEKVNKKGNKSALKIDSSKKLIGYPFYTCTGDSGAPLWFFTDEKHYLIGIHHGGNEGNIEYENTDYNVSVFLNNDVIDWINSLREAD